MRPQKTLSWPKIITPRPELGRADGSDPDAFAVSLNRLPAAAAVAEYGESARFFARTYFGAPLTELAVAVLRRLSGQSGGGGGVVHAAGGPGAGKTHALLLLGYLARGGPTAEAWAGVRTLLSKAGVARVTAADVVVLSADGADAHPDRSPWATLIEQLGASAEGEDPGPPGPESLRRWLDRDRPILFLVDEADRAETGPSPFDPVLERLAEAVRQSRANALVWARRGGDVVRVTGEDEAPAPEDRPGVRRLVLDADQRLAEILRCRLFESEPRVAHLDLAAAYAGRLEALVDPVPTWFPGGSYAALFAASYPFHPAVIQLLRRKWWSLPQFEHTLGVLRLLAPWAADGLQGRGAGPLVRLGDAPLGEAAFRRLLCRQLGAPELDEVISTDIAGGSEAIAERLDAYQGGDWYRRFATALFLLSCGGQGRQVATRAELRFVLAEPGREFGPLDATLQELRACHHLRCDGDSCRFVLSPDLDRVHARLAESQDGRLVEQRACREVRRVLEPGPGPHRIWFPDRSTQIPDRAELRLGVMPPAVALDDPVALDLVERLTLEYGPFRRMFRNGLVWLLADSARDLYRAVREVLAWEALREDATVEAGGDRDGHLDERLAGARRRLTEAVWSAYQQAVVLGEDNRPRRLELGPFLSRDEGCLMDFVTAALIRRGALIEALDPRVLLKHWPVDQERWATRTLRDRFYMSPIFPRVADAAVIARMIAAGVEQGLLGYRTGGDEQRMITAKSFDEAQVEFADDIFVVTSAEAERQLAMPYLESIEILPASAALATEQQVRFLAVGRDQYGRFLSLREVQWGASAGEIDAGGLFRAPQRAADCFVTATCGGIAVAVPVRVITPPAMASAPESRLQWTGEVPIENWAEFAERVLKPLQAMGQVQVRVGIEAGSSGAGSAGPDRSDPS